MKEVINQIHALHQAVSEPFWQKWDFWISLAFNVIGLALTYKAYEEAKKAKNAAERAATSVKTLTVAMELADIGQKLDKLDERITYSSCRDFLAEITRKVNRLTAPFAEDATLKQQITNVETALNNARTALEGVKPYGAEIVGSQYAVYIAIEAPFAILSGQLGQLIGIFESRSITIE